MCAVDGGFGVKLGLCSGGCDELGKGFATVGTKVIRTQTGQHSIL